MNDAIEPLPPRLVSATATVCLGTYLVLLMLLLVYVLINAWPEAESEVSPSPSTIAAPGATAQKPANEAGASEPAPIDQSATTTSTTTKRGRWKEGITLFGYAFRLHGEARMLVIVLVGGAIGAMIHAIQSFIQFVGFRKFLTSWIWWYLMRAPIGATLALVFYFALRGGLLAGGGGVAEQLSVAGVAALSALVGLFTEQAVRKLSDVFDTLFASKEKEFEADGLHDHLTPRPEIKELRPAVINAGTAEQMLTVQGRNFTRPCEIRIDGTARQTEFGSRTELVTRLDSADLGTLGSRRVTVVDASGVESNMALLVITNPA